MVSKSSLKEMELPARFGPSWAWVDEVFRDGEWRRSFKVEECHDGSSIVVRAELPGVDPDKDIRVNVMGGALVISAERSESHESTEHHVHRSEFRYGSFTRSIELPPGVDESKLTATYKDGILEVRVALPVESGEMAARQIEVKRA